MPVPVVVQAGLQLEPLAGKAGVQGLRAGDGVRRTPRRVDHVPHRRLGAVRQPNKTVQMIGVDVERDGRGVDGIDDGDGPVDGRARAACGCNLGLHQPDVLAHGGPGGVKLGDDVAPLVVHGVDGAVGRAGVGDGARGELLAAIVGVGGFEVTLEADGLQPVGVVVGVGERDARSGVGRDVARAVPRLRGDRLR